MPSQNHAKVHPTTGNKATGQQSGPKADKPATAGLGHTGVRSETPENAKGHLNPSAPEDANTTPGTTGEK